MISFSFGGGGGGGLSDNYHILVLFLVVEKKGKGRPLRSKWRTRFVLLDRAVRSLKHFKPHGDIGEF